MCFKLTVVLLCVVSVAFAAIHITDPSVHRNHPGKCWDSKTKKAYSPGSYTGPECTRIRCNTDYSLENATCPVHLTGKPCHIFAREDLSKPFPMCCPKIKC